MFALEMRTILVALVAVLGPLPGCRRPEPVDIMSAPATCDSVPPPLAPGERVGGELPSGISATADSGTVIGVVLQARSGRPLQAVTVRLGPVGSSVTSTPVARTLSNPVGGFIVRSVPPGMYTLRTLVIGHYPSERTIIVRPGAIDTVRAEMAYLHCVGY
jgi:hypothetical protein